MKIELIRVLRTPNIKGIDNNVIYKVNDILKETNLQTANSTANIDVEISIKEYELNLLSKKFIDLDCNDTQKPPLGVLPKYIWQEQRASELARAIKENIDCGRFGYIAKWLEELNGLISAINTINFHKELEKLIYHE